MEKAIKSKILEVGQYYVTNKVPKTITDALNMIEHDGRVRILRMKKSIEPKIVHLERTVSLVVVSENDRFISRDSILSNSEKEEIRERGLVAGFWTRQVRIRVYSEDNECIGQFYVPKSGIVIEQKKEFGIEVARRPRRSRSDSLFPFVEKEPFGDYITQKRRRMLLYKNPIPAKP